MSSSSVGADAPSAVATVASDSEILSHFAASAVDVLANGSPDSNVRQQVVMMAAMQFLGGNWGVLNQLRPQMVHTANCLCAHRSEEEAAASVSRKVYMAMGESHELNSLVANECIAGSDALGFTRDAVHHFILSLLQTLRGTQIEGDFSNMIKAGTTSCVGQWLQGICTLLKGGVPQLQPFLQRFVSVCADMVAQKYPEKTMIIKMAAPMAVGMMLQMYHQQQQQLPQ